MTTTGPASTNPERASRRSWLAVGGPLLFVVALLAGLQLAASADPVTTDVAATCTIGGSSLDVSVPLTVDDEVDPIEEGAVQTLHTESGLPSMPIVVTINQLVVTTPIPDQVASTDSVTFSGGNMAASYEVVGSDLIVTFTGPVQSDAAQIPKVTAVQTLKTGIAPTTIEWKPFSKIDADTNYGMATCTPNDPNQSVNSTEVVAGGPAPTTPPTEPTPTEPPTEPGPTTPPTEPPTEPPAPEPCSAMPALPVPLPVPEVPALCPPELDGNVEVEVEAEIEVGVSL